MKNPPRVDPRRPQYVRVTQAATRPLRTFEQCAAIMGCSTSRAHALERDAIAKIRRALIASGIVDEQGRLVRGVEG